MASKRTNEAHSYLLPKHHPNSSEERPDIASDEHHHGKRRKIATACEPCRARKGRCDGERPVCGPCRRRPSNPDSEKCNYRRSVDDTASKSKRLNGGNGTIRRMQQLGRRLEPQRMAIHPDLSQDIGRNLAGQPSAGPTPSCHLGIIHPSIRSDFIERIEDRNPSQRSSNDNAAVTAMGAMSDGRHDGTSTAYYGESSAVHFLKEFHHNFGDPEVQSRTPTFTRRKATRNSPNSNLAHIDMVLPSRRLADYLMDVYWTKSHSLYPFLYRPYVEKAYMSLWSGQNSQREEDNLDLGLGSAADADAETKIFQCALNAILALSCQLASPELPLSERDALAERFFHRAKELLHIHVLEFGSLAQVQTLLILAQYLQSTNSPTRCWNSVGLACRIGQGLGLHVPEDGLQRHETETEMRRRVWHGCYVMDSMVSTTLGRPMMTYHSHLCVPLPQVTIPSDITDDEKAAEVQYATHILLYQETIKLYQLLGKIVTKIYAPHPNSGQGQSSVNHGPISSSDVGEILTMDDDLERFETEIAPLLHWKRGQQQRASLPENVRSTVQRQSNVIQARYHHTRMLLHRPCFLQICRELAAEWNSLAPDNARCTGSRQRLILMSAMQCINSAVLLLASLHEATRAESTGAWWYTAYYAYTAGMVIVMAISCIPLHTHCDMRALRQAWTECYETMEHLEKHGSAAKVGCQSLIALHSRLLGVRSRTVASPEAPRNFAMTDTQMTNSNGSTAQSNNRTFLDVDKVVVPDARNDESREADISWAARTPFLDFLESDMDITLGGLFDSAFPDL